MSEPKVMKPNFPLSAFEFGKAIEFPVGFRELTEKSLAQSKEAYDKMKAAAEDATGALEGTFSMAAKGTADYNRKVIEVARANANAALTMPATCSTQSRSRMSRKYRARMPASSSKRSPSRPRT